MIIYLLCSKQFKDTSWSKNRIDCYKQVANRKRMLLRVIYSKEELESYKKECKKEEAVLIFALTNEEKQNEILDEYASFKMPKIIDFHHNHDIFSSEFSYVATDVYDATEQSINLLQKHGCKHIALFAMNDKTGRDIYRIKSYKKLNKDHKEIIFLDKNNGYLLLPLKALLKCNDKIDGIVCTNDLQAIRLMEVLSLIDPKWHNKLLITSFFDAKLANYYHTSLTSGTSGFLDIAKEAINIGEELWKNKKIGAIHKFVKTDLIQRESTSSYNPKGMIFSEYDYLGDKKIKEILEYSKKADRLERILLDADILDLEIIHYLMIGYKISQIGNVLYYSRSTIKYRLSNFLKICESENKEELIEIFKHYIDDKKIQKAISK